MPWTAFPLGATGRLNERTSLAHGCGVALRRSIAPAPPIPVSGLRALRLLRLKSPTPITGAVPPGTCSARIPKRHVRQEKGVAGDERPRLIEIWELAEKSASPLMITGSRQPLSVPRPYSGQ